jgi:hypothetical protein
MVFRTSVGLVGTIRTPAERIRKSQDARKSVKHKVNIEHGMNFAAVGRWYIFDPRRLAKPSQARVGLIPWRIE